MAKYSLGIELGSTRIKAVLVDEKNKPISKGEETWSASFENGIWTYDISRAWDGLKTALKAVSYRDEIGAVGISGMMHGYLVFDENWNLLVPFRTWQNTITAQAAAELTEKLQFNIPQRWSVAHLYQALLNQEEHVPQIAHVTTLSGWVHYMLTGVNAVGLGEASGMFPVDSNAMDYDETKVQIFNDLASQRGLKRSLREVFPKVLKAGEIAGTLTEDGYARLDGLLPLGVPFAPPEGDAGTGMVATNAVMPRTGNVSAGTSIFAMLVMDKALSRVYEEIDMVTTPAGKPVAMVHCNNCTGDMNAWVSVLESTAQLFGAQPNKNELYTKLYELALQGDADCGGVITCNYLAGEGITHMDSGRPLVIRRPNSKFTLPNFIRSQLYSTMATMHLGMRILEAEGVKITSLTGHGGLFKTPVVGQKLMAAACNADVTCMETAGEGGPFGMALLASYMQHKTDGETLEEFLEKRVFAQAKSTTLAPTQEDVDGFRAYMERYEAMLHTEQTAIETF
ncbi:MAG: ATPase [Oscillospiraceae bacterium]|nr:ATPase [Oscillospiraceae bacterium]